MQNRRPIAYESRKMTESEAKYFTTDKELLAIMHALTVWRCYLEGSQFRVITDHNPLVHLKAQPKLNQRQVRWVQILEQYNVTFQYRPGTTNPADPLSRLEHKEGLECGECKEALKGTCAVMRWECAKCRDAPGGVCEELEDIREARREVEQLAVMTRQRKALLEGKIRLPPPKRKRTRKAKAVAMSKKTLVAEQHYRDTVTLNHGSVEQTLSGATARSSSVREEAASGSTTRYTEKEGQGDMEQVDQEARESPSPLEGAVEKDAFASRVEFMEAVKRGYGDDEWLLKHADRVKGPGPEDLKQEDGVWIKGSQIYVPAVEELRMQALAASHDHPMAGHPGRARTLQMLQRCFWWPKMRRDVESYVKQCYKCQTIKHSTQLKQGLLQPLEIPTSRWETLTVDFISGLPDSNHFGQPVDMIAVFTDKLSRMVHFRAVSSKLDAVSMARILCEDIIRLHGVPRNIVSDRDKLFTSNFWQGVVKALKTKCRLSTAFHPESDGATEIVNKALEDYLRAFVNETQTDWAEYLWSAEFAHNIAFHDTVRNTPFTLNYGADPRSPLSALAEGLPLAQKEKAPSTSILFAERVQTALDAARQCAMRAQQRQKKYADMKRRDVTFKVGDQVLLATKNLRLSYEGLLRSPTRKLLPRFVGPFKVTDKYGTAAYRLELPACMHCHPVFHVSLLRAYVTPNRFSTAAPPPLIFAVGLEWEVDSVTDKQVVETGRGKRKRTVTWYKVTWTGYGESYQTWEPEPYLKSAREAIAAYEAKVAKG